MNYSYHVFGLRLGTQTSRKCGEVKKKHSKREKRRECEKGLK